MSDSAPTPPRELPGEIVRMLDDQPSNVLRDVSRYAEALAEYRERETQASEGERETQASRGDDQEPLEKRPDERPEGVPSKATITVKEINDNHYYYWQWREGDAIRSKYKAPVNPEE